MDVRKLLEEVKRGDTSIEEAENAFKNLPYEDLGYAKLDLHRKLRSGFPETVFCQGKPDAYLADIFETLYRENGEVLGTRATPEQWNLVRARIPEIEYDPVSKILQARKSSETPRKLEGLVAVCTGGTADIPVAEEAAKTAEFFGCRVERYYDIGVAGIHRLLSKREAIARANCVIAVAGPDHESQLHHCSGGNGRRAWHSCRRAGGKSGHCGSDLGRLWCKFSWTVGIDHDD